MPAGHDISILGLRDLNAGVDHLGVGTSVLTESIIRDYKLCREFRFAASALALARLTGNKERQELAAHVLDWLKGDIAHPALVRKALIFRKINKYSARDMLASTSHFLREAGYSGLLIIVDMTRLTFWKRMADGGINYTRQVPLDSYQAIREFIDAADNWTGLFLDTSRAPSFSMTRYVA